MVEAPQDGSEVKRQWRQGIFRGGVGGAHDVRGWNQRHWTSRLLHRIGEAVAHSTAGLIAALVAACWLVVGLFTGFPVWWQTVLYSVTSVVTFVMVFVIQHTQARQVSATQRKLDELLRSSPNASNALIAVEEAPDEELQVLMDRNFRQRRRAGPVAD